ncbi:hypothetical protein [Sporosarcina sp. JAI121]|uniref:hypothetical protein n=1 Tax=Sporosarcina sp. JAI121 TaxID=2723064 RepID=UPI0015CB19C2|nr:hypothetical protein [Sporosarcina sp. JAI121]NYF23551.1 hypothetical protein [Sporosarcina sp. JAI121]
MTNSITKEFQWFMQTLKENFKMELSAEEISVEAIELGLSKVESFFVPSELFEVVPETLLYEIMIADDETKNEWVGAVAFYPNLPDWCLQVVTKNGELILRNVLPLIQ